ncbi:uncharacterized protein LOC113325342 [Papaver somniferum]|uniref:uncharacterized protein LOC113325342 n=1 Tax=Papaver somniferum TaxID=3469 RepID=UPI000E6FCABB|nr:uncharacterized protein LOC113325342 [Papaver somniferum]
MVDEDDYFKLMDSFSSKFCYAVLEEHAEDCGFEKFLWKSQVPSKVSFILWAIFHNSLPTRDVLTHRRVQIDSEACVFCGVVRETTNHLMLHCNFSFDIWDYFIKSFHISWPLPESVLQLFEVWDNNALIGRCRKLWEIIHYVIIWILLNELSGVVFGARRKTVEEVISLVKQTLMLWTNEEDVFKFVDCNIVLHNWENVIQM